MSSEAYSNEFKARILCKFANDMYLELQKHLDHYFNFQVCLTKCTFVHLVVHTLGFQQINSFRFTVSVALSKAKPGLEQSIYKRHSPTFAQVALCIRVPRKYPQSGYFRVVKWRKASRSSTWLYYNSFFLLWAFIMFRPILT